MLCGAWWGGGGPCENLKFVARGEGGGVLTGEGESSQSSQQEASWEREFPRLMGALAYPISILLASFVKQF